MGIKLSQAITEYIGIKSRKLGAEHNTVQNARYVLGQFERMVGDRMIAGVQPRHVENFFYGPGGMMDDHVTLSPRAKKQISPPISNATHNHYRSVLRAFFNWCEARGYNKTSPMLGAPDPLREEKKTYHQPEPRELLALIEAADNPRDRGYLAVAANTGLRANEIRRMRVGDLNLETTRPYIVVVIRKTADADKQPVTEDLEKELRRWLTEYSAILGRPLRDEDVLFPRRGGGMISHYEYEDGTRVNPFFPRKGEKGAYMVRQPYTYFPDKPLTRDHDIVKKAFQNLGWEKADLLQFGTHTVRRGVARAYFDSAAKDDGNVLALRETAALLHHSSTATTERYLGTTLDREARDKRMAGKPFLSAMVAAEDNVVPLRRAEGE